MIGFIKQMKQEMRPDFRHFFDQCCNKSKIVAAAQHQP